ncbi:serine hydrolase [Salinimicrobium gaetbulicola]|uniref:Serine hydrolase n=1 Tax=Salinimicrobium gaetbulicola TaxID=999702 RepID=A0ABW3IFL2_9FLAO
MKQILILLISLSFSTTVFSQKLHLDQLKATTDSITRQLAQDDEPGLSIGVVYRGQPILNAHYGLMNLDYEMKTSDSTLYNLASVSKHITALGILLLEAEGKLQLQDKVSDHVPDLTGEYKNITINQLLHHTSGVPSTDNLLLFAGMSMDTPWTMAEELELLKRYSQLNFEPGSEYMYSNGGYSLLAAVIENTSGEDFEDFFRKRLFEPLDLQANVNNSSGKIIKNRARGYKPSETTYTDVLSESVPGASNFYFSMNDMITWMNLFLQKNSRYEQQLTKMMTPSFVLSTGDTLSYSFGLNVKDYKGVQRVYHSGGTQGFASYMLLFPEHELGITVLTNNEKINVAKTIYQLTEEILTEFLIEEKPLERIAISLPEETLHKWTGSYRMKDGMLLKIISENEKLFLVISDEQRFQLHPESETNFFIEEFDAQITFLETGKGKPSHLNLIQGKSKQTGDYVAPQELSKASPAHHDLVGSYHQKALAVTYSLIEKDGKLFLQLPGTFKKYLDFDVTILNPVAGYIFNTDRLGIIEFLRNERNEISGFRFNDVGRLRNIEFNKI